MSAGDFLRPASLRYERGRTNPDARYDDWLDLSALVREVFAPLARDGSGQVLPSLWNERTDRAGRARYVEVPTTGVVLVDGSLLGRGPHPDLAVHLQLSTGALERGTPAVDRWTLPAFTRYHHEINPPALADVVIRTDDPHDPALWVASNG